MASVGEALAAAVLGVAGKKLYENEVRMKNIRIANLEV